MSYGYPIPIVNLEKKAGKQMQPVPASSETRDDRDAIATCISAFKGPIITLFEERQEIDAFKLVPHDNAKIAVTLYRDHVCFDKENSDGSVKHLVLDFVTSTLKSDVAVISNLDTLKQLLIYFNNLYKDFLAQKATLYESQTDASQY